MITFITGNAGKFAELAAIIPDISQLDLDLPEIQSTDPRAIIAAKLTAARSEVDGPIAVEDTGLSFDALNGLPGPLIKWFLKEMGTGGLAQLAEKLGGTTARAVTWIGYSPVAGETSFFNGEVRGRIVSPKGSGFGWDPIFQPDGYDITFGEMDAETKNAISMRRKAAEAFRSAL